MTVDHDGEKIETMEGKPNPNTEKLKKLIRQLSDTQPKMQPRSLAQRYRKDNNIVIYYIRRLTETLCFQVHQDLVCGGLVLVCLYYARVFEQISFEWSSQRGCSLVRHLFPMRRNCRSLLCYRILSFKTGRTYFLYTDQHFFAGMSQNLYMNNVDH